MGGMRRASGGGSTPRRAASTKAKRKTHAKAMNAPIIGPSSCRISPTGGGAPPPPCGRWLCSSSPFESHPPAHPMAARCGPCWMPSTSAPKAAASYCSLHEARRAASAGGASRRAVRQLETLSRVAMAMAES
eukprot:scaffold33457_cov90-Isochrysis_galbana.AAC.5